MADRRSDIHPDPQAAGRIRPRQPKRSSSLRWAYAKGDKMAEDLDYVPMPDNVVTAIQKVWAAQIKDASGKPLFTASH